MTATDDEGGRGEGLCSIYHKESPRRKIRVGIGGGEGPPLISVSAR